MKSFSRLVISLVIVAFVIGSQNSLVLAVAGDIHTVAGGFTGDGGAALLAPLEPSSTGLLAGSNGSYYVSDGPHDRVRFVDSSGVITTFAGDGTTGYSGDGGLAIHAQIAYPQGLAKDSSGNVYIADRGNNAIRKVTPTGIISTVSLHTNTLNGLPPVIGSILGGILNGILPTTSVTNNFTPLDITFDANNNLYFSDGSSVYKVDSSGNTVRMAGGGSLAPSSATLATNASMTPQGIVFDSQGNLYIADLVVNEIYKVTSNGLISIVAGNGTAGYIGDGGPATSAELNQPQDLAFDSQGNLYIADANNYVVRKVNASGVITTYAGGGTDHDTSGTHNFADGTPASSLQIAANSVSIQTDGQLLTTGLLRVVRVNSQALAYKVGGNGRLFAYTGDGGLATAAGLAFPYDVAVKSDGTIYIADTYNRAIRRVSPDGVISTVAVGYDVSYLDLDSQGNVYFTDSAKVYKMDTTGNIVIIAGQSASGFSGDGGPAIAASFGASLGVTIAPDGTVLVADTQNHRIRAINSLGIVNTVAGNGTQGSTGDGGSATSAALDYPKQAIMDQLGNLYIGDYGANVVRKVNTNGIITTYAGNGTPGYTGDGGQASSASIIAGSITIGQTGNLYIAGSNTVRKVDPSGIISPVAGPGTFPPDNSKYAIFGGDGGPATNSYFGAQGIKLGTSGLYITDMINNRIRLVDGLN